MGEVEGFGVRVGMDFQRRRSGCLCHVHRGDHEQGTDASPDIVRIDEQALQPGFATLGQNLDESGETSIGLGNTMSATCQSFWRDRQLFAAGSYEARIIAVMRLRAQAKRS